MPSLKRDGAVYHQQTETCEPAGLDVFDKQIRDRRPICLANIQELETK
jgi:hypothetical protein